MRHHTATAPRDWVGAGLGAPEYFSVRAELRRLRRWVWQQIASLFPRAWREWWAEWVTPIHDWLWARWWGRLVSRFMTVVYSFILLFVACAPLALAADDKALAPLGLTDTHGVNGADYFLSLGDGGVSSMVTAAFAKLGFTVYHYMAIISIWIMHLSFGLEFLRWTNGLTLGLTETVSSMVSGFGLLPLMFMFAVLSTAFAMKSGRLSTGIYDIFLSAVIAVLAASILKNPVNAVIGEGGFLMTARNVGIKVAVAFAHGGDSGESIESSRQGVAKALTTSLVGDVAMAATFGKMLDEKCAKEFRRGIQDAKSGKKSTTDKVREGVADIVDNVGIPGVVAAEAIKPDDADKWPREYVGECDKEAGEYAKEARFGHVGIMFFLLFAGLILLAFGVYLGLRVVIAFVGGTLAAIVAIWAIVIAIAPSMRGSFFRRIADVAMAMGQISMSIIFLGAYMAAPQNILTIGSDTPLVTGFLMFDILLVAGIWAYHQLMGKVRQWSDKVENALHQRPGVEPVQITPRRTMSNLMNDVAHHQAGLLGDGANQLGRKIGRQYSGADEAWDPDSKLGKAANWASGAKISNAIGSKGRSVGSKVKDSYEDQQQRYRDMKELAAENWGGAKKSPAQGANQNQQTGNTSSGQGGNGQGSGHGNGRGSDWRNTTTARVLAGAITGGPAGAVANLINLPNMGKADLDTVTSAVKNVEAALRAASASTTKVTVAAGAPSGSSSAAAAGNAGVVQALKEQNAIMQRVENAAKKQADAAERQYSASGKQQSAATVQLAAAQRRR